MSTTLNLVMLASLAIFRWLCHTSRRKDLKNEATQRDSEACGQESFSRPTDLKAIPRKWMWQAWFLCFKILLQPSTSSVSGSHSILTSSIIWCKGKEIVPVWAVVGNTSETSWRTSEQSDTRSAAHSCRWEQHSSCGRWASHRSNQGNVEHGYTNRL